VMYKVCLQKAMARTSLELFTDMLLLSRYQHQRGSLPR